MDRVKMEDGSTKCANSMKHQVGSWYENWVNDKWYIITSVEAGEVMGEYGIDKVWLHTMRPATKEELAEREKAQAEWDAKSSEERISQNLEDLADALPSLDW